MNITIAHLYPELMNLYGESGNLKALCYHLKKQGIIPKIKKLSIDSTLDFNEYDLVYMGSGTENNRLLVLEHLLKYKQNIREAIDNKKIFLITGNAVSLFIKYIEDQEGNKTDCLKTFNLYEKEQQIRDVKEVHVPFKKVKQDLYGFINKSGIIYKNNNEVLESNLIFHKNFFGSYLIGPLLVRNPEFNKYIIKLLVNKIDKNYKLKPFNMRIEENAYFEFIDFKNKKEKKY
jgi:Predicted glutamine amidotransferase